MHIANSLKCSFCIWKKCDAVKANRRSNKIKCFCTNPTTLGAYFPHENKWKISYIKSEMQSKQTDEVMK